jgi:ATP-dependent exoDNAse (exonuclease V) beta subunit
MRISASAGSGKTYRLALRYIALLVLGADPERMIALTFTRKAAAEFTERIITRLAEAANDHAKADKLAEEVVDTIKGKGDCPALVTGVWEGNPPTQEEFRHLLKKLINVLGRLNMSTLDSFFTRMTQALSLDLGVAAIQMVQDPTLLKEDRQNVLKELYSQAETDDDEKKAFSEVFKLTTLGKEQTRVDRTINDILDQFHEAYLTTPDADAWGNEEKIWGENKPWWWTRTKPLNESIKLIKKSILANNPDDRPKSKKKDPNEIDKRTYNGVKSFVGKLEKNETPFSTLFSLENINGWLSGSCDFYYYKKTYTWPDETWVEIFLDAVGAYIRREILNLASRTQGIYSLIKKVDALYEKRVRAKGKLLFGDVTRLLLSNSNEKTSEAIEDLRFRMDGWYDHWMLDEFQDTSHDQWKVIEPFLDEVAQDPEQTRSIFVVGDTKQSIYQWRGGDPVIFDNLAKVSPWKDIFQEFPMDTSYRSAPAIINFVNRVCSFSHSASCAHGEALKRWDFRQHQSATHLQGLSGCVQMWWQNKDAKRDDTELSFVALTELLNKIRPLDRVNEDGKKLSCAILVETNKRADDVRDWLVSEEGGSFPAVVEADVSVGTDSTFGISLEQFFKWLNHPDDQLAYQYLTLSPYNVFKDDTDIEWKRWNRVYEMGGISEVIRTWIQAQKIDESQRLTAFDMSRLKIWNQNADEFDAKGGDLDEWLQVVSSMTQREHAVDGAIQIMTWHKAKGLEFDILILPFPERKASFANSRMLDVLSEEDGSGNVQKMILKPAKELIAMDDKMNQMFEVWEGNEQFQGFCKLYVALTRAKRACYIILPKSQDDDSDKVGHTYILNSIREGLEQQPCPLGDAVLPESYYEGDPDWYLKCPLTETVEETPVETLPTLPKAQKVAKVVSPSSLGHETKSSLSYSPEALQLGTDVHRCLSEIEWLDDDSDEVMATWPDSVKELVVPSFNSPDFRRYFMRPEGAQEARVWREKAVAGKIDGQLIYGIADRVSLVDGFLTIMDFKTDKNSDPEELKSRYQEQLECYRRLLCAALGIPDEKSSCVILAVRSGLAIEFGPNLAYQSSN